MDVDYRYPAHWCSDNTDNAGNDSYKMKTQLLFHLFFFLVHLCVSASQLLEVRFPSFKLLSNFPHDPHSPSNRFCGQFLNELQPEKQLCWIFSGQLIQHWGKKEKKKKSKEKNL